MIDREKIRQAIRLFLEGIGEDPDREGLKETPERIARMWEEFESMRSFDMKLFEEFGNYNEMVLVKDIRFYSLCEHHLLPFFGKVHIAYVPDNLVCGLSKLVRTVRAFSLRPQVQERLTEEIADFLNRELKPKGVGVVIEAEHLCYSSDTEVLTEEGWKPFKDLTGNERVAQVYPETLEVEFTRPLMLHRYAFSGLMVGFLGKHIDLLVSPDHRMLYAEGMDGKLLMGPAYRLLGRRPLIPCAGFTGDFGALAPESRGIVRFLALYVRQGEVRGREVFVRCRSERDRAILRESVPHVPFSYSLSREGAVVRSPELAEHLRPLGDMERRRLPAGILSLSCGLKEEFIRTLSATEGKLRFLCLSKRLAGDLQAILATMGYMTNLYYGDDGKWCLKAEKVGYPLGEATTYRMPYTGFIYSLTVPSGFLLVRRNYKTAVSGNCMSMRGVMSPGHVTTTSALRGAFLKDIKTREEFLKLIRGL